jgi:uncharacterized protein
MTPYYTIRIRTPIGSVYSENIDVDKCFDSVDVARDQIANTGSYAGKMEIQSEKDERITVTGSGGFVFLDKDRKEIAEIKNQLIFDKNGPPQIEGAPQTSVQVVVENKLTREKSTYKPPSQHLIREGTGTLQISNLEQKDFIDTSFINPHKYAPQVLKQTEEYVRKTLEGEGSGHDWWHIQRVRNNALHIGKEENADLFVVELVALLHDIADWKSHEEKAGPVAARAWLEKLGVDESIISHVCDIIAHMSFKGAGVKSELHSKEGKVVQDADRLDALGAIGIARCFAYGGNKQREIYNPNIKPALHQTAEEYKNNKGTSINHFYEKLLLLKDRMNTAAGKKLAEERHKFMEQYLDRFFNEWEGKS